MALMWMCSSDCIERVTEPPENDADDVVRGKEEAELEGVTGSQSIGPSTGSSNTNVRDGFPMREDGGEANRLVESEVLRVNMEFASEIDVAGKASTDDDDDDDAIRVELRSSCDETDRG